uniref:Reverse transcriptase domain-containing protein n=1 Tax=Cannabis sativa TaxID=3483 RepID=A0A803NSN9_CANSA
MFHCSLYFFEIYHSVGLFLLLHISDGSGDMLVALRFPCLIIFLIRKFLWFNSRISSIDLWGKEITGNFRRRIRECNSELKLLKNKKDDISVARYNEGQFVDWDNGLADVVVNYFVELFSASDTEGMEVIDSIDQVVPNLANMEFAKPVTEEEMRVAVFQMHPDKSPGPDEMTPAFYQRCWNIVKHDLVMVVQRFFSTGVFDENCSEASVVLIPKKKGPETMKDLRPIAMCNVLYKIVTKVMTNRMKPFMDSIVADSQSAFISGCLISNNIMVSFEVLHYLKRKRQGKTGCMALKVDMSKAYDRIEWRFLEAVLRKLGFIESWVHLIMQCVSTAHYKILHGCHEMGPIVPTRGIRQAIEAEACRVQELLRKFEMASGQEVNLTKSSIFFSTNTSVSDRNVISQQLRMSIASEDSFYLGLPSTMTRKKTVVLGYLKERVQKKLQSWEGKFLSRAGKEILVKTVVQALPSYAMSVFLLPKEISHSIESMMATYWWQANKDSGKGIHWISWEKLCKHKKRGAMGFRNLRDFNLAMLGKQGWRLLTRPNALVSRVFKARYFPHCDFLSASIRSNPSFVWRSIWESQEIVKKGVRWCIGTGQDIPILGSPWLPDDINPYVISDHPALSNATVNNLLTVDGLSWDAEVIDDLFMDRDKHLIMEIPLQVESVDTTTIWAFRDTI